MAASKTAEAANLIWILLTIFLGWCMAAWPGFWAAAAADTPPEHPATAGPIIADTAVPTPPGQWIIQPFLSLDFVTGSLTGNWRRVSAGGDFTSFQMPVKVTYGLMRNLEIYAMIPFIHNRAAQVQDAAAWADRAADFSGMGDLSVILKYQLLAETAWRPTVAAFFAVDLPTGHHFHTNPARLGTDVLGAGTFAFTGGANLAKWLGPLYIYANLWYGIATQEPRATPHLVANPLTVPVHGRDLITWNLAAEYPLGGPWVALVEWYSGWEVGPLFRRSHAPPGILMGVMPGIEYLINSRWAWQLGVAVDLAGKNSLYGITPIFTVIMTY